MQTNGPKLVASLWSMTAISVIFLALRFWCKFRSRKQFWWDDYILAAAWLCNLLQAALSIPTTAKGLGNHGQDINPANFSSIFLLFNISGIFSILGVALSKTSFAVTLLRIGRGPILSIVWFVLISMNVLFFINILFLWVRCSPVARVWDETVPGTCWEPHIFPNFAIAAGAYSAAMDFLLATVPWIIIWKLKMKRNEKIGIALAMSMGFLAGITAIVKCVQVTALASSDFTYVAPYLAIWSVAENAVTIIASSIPFLRVLRKDAASRYKSESKGTTHDYEMMGGHRNTATFASDARVSPAAGYSPKQDELSDGSAPNAADAR